MGETMPPSGSLKWKKKKCWGRRRGKRFPWYFKFRNETHEEII